MCIQFRYFILKCCDLLLIFLCWNNLFFELRREMGQTFVIVTHNEELAAMADRKIIIKDGQNTEADN